MKQFILILFISIMMIVPLLSGDEKENLVILETNYGKITIRLFFDKTPLHANNFKKLVSEGFYDGLMFHRVIPGFVIQGGDPLSKDENPNNDGTGGPGYVLPAEIGQPHLKGAVASARLGDQANPRKESNGSQFYIALKNLPNLDRGGYTVFGEVVSGWDAINAIAKLERDRRDRPISPAIIKKAYMSLNKPTKEKK